MANFSRDRDKRRPAKNALAPSKNQVYSEMLRLLPLRSGRILVESQPEISMINSRVWGLEDDVENCSACGKDKKPGSTRCASCLRLSPNDAQKRQVESFAPAAALNVLVDVLAYLKHFYLT